MFNVGGGELLVILLIALLVLGPDRLPGFARKAGKLMGDVRRVSRRLQSEIRQAMDFDDDKPTPTPPATPRLVEPPAPASGPRPDGSQQGDPASPGSGSTSSADQNGDETTSGTSAA